MSASKQAFLTGATGFLGHNLVAELRSEGWEVVALRRQKSRVEQLEAWGVRFVLGDIHDVDSLTRAMPYGCDAVFHLAANISLWARNAKAQIHDNVDGTYNLLEVARDRGAKRFVFTSSVEAWGVKDAMVDEGSPQQGRTSNRNYAQSKFFAEQNVRGAVEVGLPCVIMNPGHIMGAYDFGGWSRTIRMVYENSLPGIPPGSGSFAHVREVARAHIRAAEKGALGANYLLGGPNVSFLELISLIGQKLDRKVPKRALPSSLLHLIGRFNEFGSRFTNREPDLTLAGAHMVCSKILIDSSRAERELGYRVLPLEKVVDDAIAWLRETKQI